MEVRSLKIVNTDSLLLTLPHSTDEAAEDGSRSWFINSKPKDTFHLICFLLQPNFFLLDSLMPSRS